MYVLSISMKNVRFFLSENIQFLEVKFSIYLRRSEVSGSQLYYVKKKIETSSQRSPDKVIYIYIIILLMKVLPNIEKVSFSDIYNTLKHCS